MSNLVLVNRLTLVLAFVGAIALTSVHSASAETNTPAQFAVKTTSGVMGAPVRTADFSSADRQNVTVQPVHFGRGGYYGGNFYGGRGYAGLNYGYRPYYGGGGYRSYNFGYQPYYAAYRPYNVYRAPYYGYGATYASYYPPYYNYSYFRAPYYASPPVYFGYPQNVYYAPSFASYGNCYYW